MNCHNQETPSWIRLTAKISMTNLPVMVLILTLLIAVALTSPAIAQSGSRSAPTGTSAFNSPSSQFNAQATGFIPPIVSAENASLPTQSFSQFPEQAFTPQQFSTVQPAAVGMSSNSSTGQSSGSIGIPAAAVVDPIFEINDPYSAFAVDHSAWDRFLSCYLITDQQGLNRIRYGNVSNVDRQQLSNYLCYLQSVDVRMLSRDEQLAYWFNLYNAKIIDVVLANYPIRSIRQIKQKFTDFVGPFDDEGVLTVLGKPLSLSDIESGIVRPIWKDPRIHYALNCGSYGCPNLAKTAWRAENLDARLNGAAINFINSGRAVKSCLGGLRLSKIYKWYKDDFGGTDQAVIAHMQQYANPTTCRQLQNANGKIRGHFYDWSLNDAKIKRRRLLEPLIR